MDKERALTAKQASFVQYYADTQSETYNNATQSMIKAGYTDNYTHRHVNRMMSHDVVKQEIAKYRARIGKKYEHNRNIALRLLEESIAGLDLIISKNEGSLAAVQAFTARTSAVRELNAISNLHSTTVTTNTDQPDPLTVDEVKALKQAAKQVTAPKLSNTG